MFLHSVEEPVQCECGDGQVKRKNMIFYMILYRFIFFRKFFQYLKLDEVEESYLRSRTTRILMYSFDRKKLQLNDF